jgi:hypothetical protein
MSNNLYIKAQAPSTPATSGWTRNPDWLSLESVQAGDNKLSGLWAVFEDEPSTHWFNYQIGDPTSTSLVSHGDGTPDQVASSNVLYQHQYDYATLSGSVLTDSQYGNYKMVIINITFGDSTIVRLDPAGTNGYTGKNTGWLDVAMDCGTMNTLNISSARDSFYLERLLIYDEIISSAANIFINMPRLRIFDAVLSSVASFQGAFSWTGDFRKNDGTPYNLIANSAASMNSTFTNSFVTHIGTISSTSVTLSNGLFSSAMIEIIDEINLTGVTNGASFLTSNLALREITTFSMPNAVGNGMFNGCIALERIGNNVLNMPGLTNGLNLFNNCRRLESMDLSSSSGLTGAITAMFQSCYQIRSIILGDCSNVTGTVSMFSACDNLRVLRMPNLKVSVIVSSTAIEAPEMVDLFNDLFDRTSLASANINITNTPASVDLSAAERDIALNKNWTITG